MIFENRKEAGKLLGGKLREHDISNPVVLALARGGVPVGFEVTKTLHTQLEVLLVRKITAPSNPEFGIGAIAEGGAVVSNEIAMSHMGISQNEFTNLKKEKEKEIKRKVALYRSRPLSQLAGKTAVIVDDGLATGVTALAAIKAVRKLIPQKIILAAPVAGPETIKILQKDVDKIIVLYEPEYLEAIGAYYRNFEQVPDEEVIKLLGFLS